MAAHDAVSVVFDEVELPIAVVTAKSGCLCLCSNLTKNHHEQVALCMGAKPFASIRVRNETTNTLNCIIVLITFLKNGVCDEFLRITFCLCGISTLR